MPIGPTTVRRWRRSRSARRAYCDWPPRPTRCTNSRAFTTPEVVVGLIPSPTVLSVDEMGRIAPPIFTSVGRGGVNAPGDVFVIQSLLNDRLPKPHAAVQVTGVT